MRILPATALCGVVILAFAGSPDAAQPGASRGPMQSGSHTSQTDSATSGSANHEAAKPATGKLGSTKSESQSDAATGQTGAAAEFDVDQLFATACGWCHSAGGREAGKGPQLLNSTLSDGEITYRIRTGKAGRMPAYGSNFTESQLQAIVAYIRNLKPTSN